MFAANLNSKLTGNNTIAASGVVAAPAKHFDFATVMQNAQANSAPQMARSVPAVQHRQSVQHRESDSREKPATATKEQKQRPVEKGASAPAHKGGSKREEQADSEEKLGQANAADESSTATAPSSEQTTACQPNPVPLATPATVSVPLPTAAVANQIAKEVTNTAVANPLRKLTPVATDSADLIKAEAGTNPANEDEEAGLEEARTPEASQPGSSNLTIEDLKPSSAPLPAHREDLSAARAPHDVSAAGSASTRTAVQAAETWNDLSIRRYDASTPNRLEVGLARGDAGWLHVRAELGSTGELRAYLSGATGEAHRGLTAQALQMETYLSEQAVRVDGVHVVSRIGAHDVSQTDQRSAAFASDAGTSGQSGANRRDESAWEISSGREMRRSAGLPDIHGEAIALGAMRMAGASGGWLSVRV